MPRNGSTPKAPLTRLLSVATTRRLGAFHTHMMTLRSAAVVCALVAMPGQASAHMVIQGVGGFYGGFLHPILNPVHALGLVGLGLFVGGQKGYIIYLMVFAVSVAAGLFAISLGTGATPAETILTAITIVLGLLIALAWSPPEPIAAILVGGAGLVLGLDSPPQAITISEGNLMLAGTEFGACLALAVIAFCAKVATHRLARIGVRILGSWIAASAIMVLAMTLVQ
jgi:hydrogenase/urease accessory protein HupE